MSERDLGLALLRLDASDLAGVPDLRQQTWKVLERDRQRVRFLTGLTLVTWLAAVGLVLFVFVGLGLLFPRHAKLMRDMEQGKIDAATIAGVQVAHQEASQMLTLAIAGSVGVLALAALCTVGLVLYSRRAMLRQINASLVVISQQLGQRPAGAVGP